MSCAHRQIQGTMGEMHNNDEFFQKGIKQYSGNEQQMDDYLSACNEAGSVEELTNEERLHDVWHYILEG